VCRGILCAGIGLREGTTCWTLLRRRWRHTPGASMLVGLASCRANRHDREGKKGTGLLRVKELSSGSRMTRGAATSPCFDIRAVGEFGRGRAV